MTPPPPPPSPSRPGTHSPRSSAALHSAGADTAHRLLIVDDDAGQRQLLEKYLSENGFSVHTASSGEEALALLADRPFAMVVSDIRMPGMSGLEMLRHIRDAHLRLPVLLVTAYADIRDAVEAMRDGAVNYLEKPVDLDELLSSVRYSLGIQAPGQADNSVPLEPPPPEALRGFIYESLAMRDVVREILAVAPADSRVLITGESGSGKEVAAGLIHRLSPRAARPIVRLNCAGTPAAQIESELFGIEAGALDDSTIPGPGLLEQAQGGTLILDEAGELPPESQMVILRLIESGTYRRGRGAAIERRADVRILAITRTSLENEVKAGKFREDLYYRLCMFGIHIPPLSERRADILPLAGHFLEAAGLSRPRFSPAALICLETYNWPGNVRELRNAMERAALLARGDMILPEHLPRRVREALEMPAASTSSSSAAGESATATMDDIERSVILQTLRENHFNRSETARRLGISRRALIYKLRRFREQGFSIEP